MVGVLFIVCTVASILSVVPLGSTLDSPAYLGKLAVGGNRVVLTALNIPIGIQEMVMAVWLIAKGFGPGTAASENGLQPLAA